MRAHRSLLRSAAAVATCVFLLGLAPLSAQERSLTFGMVPSEETASEIKRSQAVFQALEQDLGVKVVPQPAADYISVVEAMRSKKVDVAWFGAFAYVMAAQEAGAQAFVAGVRKKTGRPDYRSHVLVKASSPYYSLGDLRGKTFTFVDPASTSGHLVPRAVMAKMGIKDPATYFGRVVFAGGHDAAQLSVLNGKVDAAATNDRVMDQLIKTGAVKPGDFRVILWSDPIPLGPVAYRRDLPEELKSKLKHSFLRMKNVTFAALGELTGFVEVTDKTYDVIRETAQILRLDLRKIAD